MINKKEKLKLRSIINMCNAIKEKDLKDKENSDYWVIEIIKICQELGGYEK